MALQKKTRVAKTHLVGGFNPVEKYQSNWMISASRREHRKSLKPPPSIQIIYQIINSYMPDLYARIFQNPPVRAMFETTTQSWETNG